jgi:cation:H+ antiporter
MAIFFTPLFNISFNIILLSFSILLLWKGADYLVESASKSAEKLGVSDLVIGLTIVAFGTSGAGICRYDQRALKHQADISVET